MKDYQVNRSHLLFDELISKTVQYMAAKTDKSLFRVSVPNSIAEDDIQFKQQATEGEEGEMSEGEDDEESPKGN